MAEVVGPGQSRTRRWRLMALLLVAVGTASIVMVFARVAHPLPRATGSAGGATVGLPGVSPSTTPSPGASGAPSPAPSTRVLVAQATTRPGTRPGPGSPPVAYTPSPTLPPVPPPANTIGYLGCSQTDAAVKGYALEHGDRLWLDNGRDSGGAIEPWAKGTTDPRDKLWQGFEAAYAAAPTSQVWWQLCTHPENTDTDNYNNALIVIANLQRKVPGLRLFVSAQNAYGAPHVCAETGADGPSRMQALAARLVQEGRAYAGPDVGSLLSTYQTPSAGATNSNNQTTTDGCHPNDAGMRYLGDRIKAFGW